MTTYIVLTIKIKSLSVNLFYLQDRTREFCIPVARAWLSRCEYISKTRNCSEINAIDYTKLTSTIIIMLVISEKVESMCMGVPNSTEHFPIVNYYVG